MADRLLAEILEYQGRSAEAAALLPAAPPQELSERIRWAVTRAERLYWVVVIFPPPSKRWTPWLGDPRPRGPGRSSCSPRAGARRRCG